MTGISGGASTRTGGPQAPAPRLVRTGTSPTAACSSMTGCWSGTAYRKGHSWPPWVWPESWRSTPVPAADGGLGLVRGEQREGVGRDAGERGVDVGGIGSAPGLVVDAAIRMLADPSVSVTFSLRRTSMPRVSQWSIHASASCEMNSWLPLTAKTPSGASRSASGASASDTWLTLPSMRSPPSTTTSGCCALTWSTTRRVKPASRIGPTCRSVTSATRRPSSSAGRSASVTVTVETVGSDASWRLEPGMWRHELASSGTSLRKAVVPSAATTTSGVPPRRIDRRASGRWASLVARARIPRTSAPSRRYHANASQVMPTQASHRVPRGSMTPLWTAKAQRVAAQPSVSTTVMPRRAAVGQPGATARRRWRMRVSSARSAATAATKNDKEVSRRGSGGGAEADGVALARLLALDLAVLGRRGRRQVLEEVGRRVGDRLDRLVEGRLVGLAGLGAPADLADVLQRGGTDLVARRGRLEVVELSDVAAHASTVCRGTHAGPLQTASFEVMALPTSVLSCEGTSLSRM